MDEHQSACISRIDSDISRYLEFKREISIKAMENDVDIPLITNTQPADSVISASSADYFETEKQIISFSKL